MTAQRLEHQLLHAHDTPKRRRPKWKGVDTKTTTDLAFHRRGTLCAFTGPQSDDCAVLVQLPNDLMSQTAILLGGGNLGLEAEVLLERATVVELSIGAE